MTAAVAEKLAKEGRLDLDAPVSRYIPGFPNGPKGGTPTVRQLLEHRAGVPHRVTEPIDETQRLLPADIVERVKKGGLPAIDARPGDAVPLQRGRCEARGRAGRL